MAFDPGKVHKLRDEFESMAYDWMFERIQEVYGVDDPSELNEDQIQEIFESSESDQCEMYVGMALRSMIE